jgi:plastocyanin
MRGLAFVAFTICALFVLHANASRLSGKVTVTKELREALDKAPTSENGNARLFYWNEPNGIIPVRLPQVDIPGDIVVVLEKEGAKTSKPDELTTLKILSGELERDVIAVRPGTTVRFQSIDPFDHELYSPGMEEFRPERQATGGFRPIEFKKEGVYEVRCKLMPHFRGYVIVTTALSILQIAKDGTFSMEDLSEGKYTLKVFHNGDWIHQEKFELKKNQKRSIQLNVKLKPKTTADKSAQPEKKSEVKPGDKATKP